MADAIKRLNDAALLMNEGDASSPDTLLQVRATLQDARQQQQLSASAALPDLERAVDTIDKMIAAPEGERDALLEQLGDQLDRVTECLGLELEQLELEVEMADDPGPEDAPAQAAGAQAAEAQAAEAQGAGAQGPTPQAADAASSAEQASAAPEASAPEASASEAAAPEASAPEASAQQDPPADNEESGTLNLLPQDFDAEMMPEFVTEAKELIEQAEQAAGTRGEPRGPGSDLRGVPLLPHGQGGRGVPRDRRALPVCPLRRERARPHARR